MDVTAFLSTYAQASAALLGVMAAFIVAKLLNDDATGEELRRRVKRRVVASEDLVLRIGNAPVEWVVARTYDLWRSRVVDYFRDHPGTPVNQALPDVRGHFSRFSEPAWVALKVDECRDEAEAPSAPNNWMVTAVAAATDKTDLIWRVQDEERHLEGLYVDASSASDRERPSAG